MAKLTCFVLVLLGEQVIGLKIVNEIVNENEKFSGGEKFEWNTVEAAKYVERKVTPPDGSECRCKKWSNVYKAVPGMCGNGGEFTSEMARHKIGDLNMAKTIWNQTLCNDFFRLLDTDECVLHHGDNEKGTYQWCYTEAHCDAPDMNEKRPTSHVVREKGHKKYLAKKCTAGVDRLLSDRTPEQLVNFKTQFGPQMKLHVLMSYAYPKTSFNPRNFQLEDMFRVVNMRGEDIKDKADAKAYSLVEPNMPMLLSVDDQQDMIVLGKTLYKVRHATEKLECLVNCPGSDTYVWNPRAAKEFRILDKKRREDLTKLDDEVDNALKHYPVAHIEARFEDAFQEMEKEVAKAEGSEGTHGQDTK